VHILWGHESAVTAVALCTPLDLVVSGAANGHVLLHRVQASDLAPLLAPLLVLSFNSPAACIRVFSLLSNGVEAIRPALAKYVRVFSLLSNGVEAIRPALAKYKHFLIFLVKISSPLIVFFFTLHIFSPFISSLFIFHSLFFFFVFSSQFA